MSLHQTRRGIGVRSIQEYVIMFIVKNGEGKRDVMCDEREKNKETERDRERQREIERQTDRQREIERGRETHS